MNKKNNGNGVTSISLNALEITASIRVDLVEHRIESDSVIDLVFESLARIKSLAGILESAGEAATRGAIEPEDIAGTARIIKHEAESIHILIDGIGKVKTDKVSHEHK